MNLCSKSKMIVFEAEFLYTFLVLEPFGALIIFVVVWNSLAYKGVWLNLLLNSSRNVLM
jgi:hypothetical protein